MKNKFYLLVLFPLFLLNACSSSGSGSALLPNPVANAGGEIVAEAPQEPGNLAPPGAVADPAPVQNPQEQPQEEAVPDVAVENPNDGAGRGPGNIPDIRLNEEALRNRNQVSLVPEENNNPNPPPAAAAAAPALGRMPDVNVAPISVNIPLDVVANFYFQEGQGTTGRILGVNADSNIDTKNLLFSDNGHQGNFLTWFENSSPDRLFSIFPGFDLHQNIILARRLALSADGRYYASCVLNSTPQDVLPPHSGWSCLVGKYVPGQPQEFHVFSMNASNGSCNSCLDLSVNNEGLIVYAIYDDSRKDQLGYTLRLGSFSIEHPQDLNAEETLVQIPAEHPEFRNRLAARSQQIPFRLQGTSEIKIHYDGNFFYLAVKESTTVPHPNTFHVNLYKFGLENGDGFLPGKRITLHGLQQKNMIRDGFLAAEGQSYPTLVRVTKMRFRGLGFEVMESMQFPEGARDHKMELVLQKAALRDFNMPVGVYHFPHNQDTVYDIFSYEPMKQDERYLLFAGLRAYRPGGAAKVLDSFVLSYANGASPISKKSLNLAQTFALSEDDLTVIPQNRNQGGNIILSLHVPSIAWHDNNTLSAATVREWFRTHPQDEYRAMLIRLNYNN